MSRSGPTVAVIGGGVIGCAVAFELARRGVAVTLLERDQPGGRASSAAAGMLSPLGEADAPGPFLDLGIRSLERYPEFVREVEAAAGMEVGYRKEGRLDVAFDEAAEAALRQRREMQARAGYDGRILEPAELGRVEPHVSEEARVGLVTEFDHQVDNERLARALWIAAEREGVAVLAGSGAAGVLVSDDGARVTGVRLDSGDTVPAEAVVVAAGAWSGRLELPRPLPVRPVRGQIVVLRTVPAVLRRVTWGPGCYMVPRADGRLLVGATMEEAGFVETATAGGTVALLAAAVRIVPTLADAHVEGFQVGLRPGTPDGLPILGRDPDVEGLVYATGHFRNGILLTPETAAVVASIILDGDDAESAFSPARFPNRESVGL